MKFTVTDAFDDIARKFSRKTAFMFADTDIRKTYSELSEDIDAFCKALLSLDGLKPESKIGIYAATSYEWILAKYAINKINCVTVAINSNCHWKEMKYILEKTDVEAVLIGSSTKYNDYYQNLCNAYPELTYGFPKDSGCIDLCHLYLISQNKSLRAVIHDRQSQITPLSPAVIIQSSGSTGEPKFIVLSHQNVVANAKFNFDGMRLNIDNKVLLSLPMYHSFGYICIEATNTLNGLTTIVAPMAAKPDKIMEIIETHRCTVFHGTPTTFYDLMHSPSFGRYDLSSLRNATVGATTLLTAAINKIRAAFGFEHFMQSFGLTETAGAVVYADTRDFNGYTPIEQTELRIVDRDTLKELPRNQIGEIQIRGVTVFTEYYKDLERTMKAKSADGWLSTGDLGLLNSENKLEITGRCTDMIIKGGVNIAPVQVEMVLADHPKILDCNVVGVHDERLGEEVCVFIRPLGKIEKKDVIDFAKERLSHIKIPKHVVFTKEFPKTSVGKVSKKLLREVFESKHVAAEM